MKKKYITPVIGKKFMEASELLTASVIRVHDETADVGSSDNRQNFSRQGSFWDDAE